MTERTSEPTWDATYFHHRDGHLPAFGMSRRFACNGRIATLPDVLAARVADPNGGPAWTNYFTTLSAEYYGRGPDGFVVAVLHGTGPLSTEEGITEAYARTDRDGRYTCGQVTQETFDRILRGEEGPVTVLALPSDPEACHDAFATGSLTPSEARRNPYLMARLGPAADAYLDAHDAMSAETLRRAGIDPSKRGTQVVSLELHHDAHYGFGKPEVGFAWAHLLSVGQLVAIDRNDDGHRARHVECDVSHHGWNDGTRYLAIKDGADLACLSEGPDHGALLADPRGRATMTVPRDANEPVGFREVADLGDGTFAALGPRESFAGDVDVPVLTLTDVGPLSSFEVPCPVPHSSCAFTDSDVEPLRPDDANAYVVDAVTRMEDWQGYVVRVRFVHVTYDTSRRYVREDDFYRDHDMVGAALDAIRPTKIAA